MTILELENLTGLDRATIRFYEKEGLICPERKENSYRDYSDTDLQEILKIKLLRQLDLPVYQIKNLQQGSADISSVLRQQGAFLAKQSVYTEYEAKICMEISEADATYNSLDASVYLEKLKEAEKGTDDTTVTYHNPAPTHREYHPVRRYVARVLDYTAFSMIIRFFLIVVLRIRPYEEWISTVISYSVPFVCLPLHALLLSKFGTTPGKWMMGIRIEALNGRRLSFGAALQREWNALRYGYGFGIPVWSLWRQIRSYMEYKEYLILDHDRYVDYHYTYWKPGKKAVFAVVCACIVLLSYISGFDASKPRYRGSDLTVAEFAENYNHYMHIYEKSSRMNPDGTWYVPEKPQNGNAVVIIEISKPEKTNEPFHFETEGERVTRITYENSWTEVFALSPVGNMTFVMMTAVGSQKGVGVAKLKDFLELVQSHVNDTTGHIQFENIEINWSIKAVNCFLSTNGTFYRDDETKESSVRFSFEIIIHETE